MAGSHYPTLYQINTRVWLYELGERLGRPVKLDDVPDVMLDELAAAGLEWVWLLGIWQTGEAGRQVSLERPEWRADYQRVLPDFRDEDVCGSPFAIFQYVVHWDFGGDECLAQFRRRLADRGIKLMLDFVPNHTALDHHWAASHPAFYIHGTPADIAREPRNFTRVLTSTGEQVIAHGRDPYFPGWPDTLQLNYRHAGLRHAMVTELKRIAQQCDGLRCDMAMLVQPEIIQRTWHDRSAPADGSRPVDVCFWSEAIPAVKFEHPEFIFVAEVYWDLEWRLQQQGFDYTYDKRMYDRLHARDAGSVRGHLWATPDFQRRSVRFLENHDEQRAASAFPPRVHEAAAVLAMLVPGMRLFHEGQLEGRQFRTSIHLRRREREPVSEQLRDFYQRLLAVLKRPQLRRGSWRLLDWRPAWEGNSTCDKFVAFWWDPPEDAGGRLWPIMVVVNFGPTQGQCHVQWPASGPERTIMLRDLLNSETYERQRSNLLRYGLYVDLPAWGFHVFEVQG